MPVRRPLQAKKLHIKKSLTFVGARFQDTRVLELQAGEKVSLRRASFAQSLSLSVESPKLDASAACFERGADVLLRANSCGGFAGASFFGPSLVATKAPSKGSMAKIESLEGTRIERLVLQSVDLSECSFARLHRLDDVLIAGRGQLALAPAVVKGSYRREILADEAVRRAGEPSLMLSWAPITWEAPPLLAEQSMLSPQSIAEIYRAMRKAREDSNDYPGAADFYYGEMEMRREGADNWVERMILTLYWLISGYGMRAARAMVAFVLLGLLFSVGFQTIGFSNPPNFWHTVAWTMTTSISLIRPAEHMDLTPVGMYLNVAIRIIGPALIALVVLALRSRVRR